MYSEMLKCDGFLESKVGRRTKSQSVVNTARRRKQRGFSLLEEIVYRWRLVISAPTRKRALEIEREVAFAQQHRLAEEYSQGYLEGWHDCYAACLDAVEEEASRRDDVWAAGELLIGPENSLRTN
jgi:hypothetical protein